MTILWKIPLTSDNSLENATEHPLENAAGSPRCFLRCRILVCNLLPLVSARSGRWTACGVCTCVRGWRRAVGHLIVSFGAAKTCRRLRFIGTWVETAEGVRFHRARDFRPYYLNRFPPTPHLRPFALLIIQIVVVNKHDYYYYYYYYYYY